MYETLRHSQFPVFIWGAGSMSIEVEKRLYENGISPVGRFINTQMKQSHLVHSTDPIYSFNELKNSYSQINVVMGHGHYEKATELQSDPFVNMVYIIPNPYTQYKGPDQQYIHDNADKIASAKKLLIDDHSRLVLEKYLAFSSTNEIQHLLDSDICIGGIFNLNDLNLSSTETFADIGAWEGDTIDAFLRKTNGCYEHIYAVEPDPCTFKKLSSKFEEDPNISLFQCGLGKQEGEFYLSTVNSQSTSLSEAKTSTSQKVGVTTIDQLFEKNYFRKGGYFDNNISEKHYKYYKIDLIKIFVPFMFLDILKGGANLIKQNRPRLIINVTADDKFSLFDTIQWIADLNVNYKLALRFDFPMPTRLFLYAY